MGICQHAHQIIGVQHQGTQLRTGGTTLHHRQIQLEVFQHIIKIIYGIRKKDYLQSALLVAVPSERRGGEIALGRMRYADAEQ